MARWWPLLALWLTACAFQAPRPDDPTCTTPRDAADSLLAWQNAPHVDLARATRCMATPPGMDPRRTAIDLKAVLDARGLIVPVDSLPDTPDAGGEREIRPFGTTFPLVLRRGSDGLWRYARETLEATPRLHAETFSPLVTALKAALPSSFSQPIGAVGIAGWQIVLLALLVVASLVGGRLVRLLINRYAEGLAKRLSVQLDATQVRALDGPLVVLAGFLVFTWGLPQLRLPVGVSATAAQVLAVGLRLALVVAAFRAIDLLAELGRIAASRTVSKLDDQLIPLVRSAARFFVLVFGFLILLEAAGVDVWKLIAGVGIGGIAFALAAQDTVANLFGSINVFVDRPFQIGDWVIIDGVEGVVEEVGFRSTRIRTFYNSQVTVPNSRITNANVDNMGRRHRRRTKLSIGLTYDTPPDKLQAYVEGCRAILAAHPAVEKSYEVHLSGLGASSIDILVYYHLVVPDWHAELVARSQNLLEFIRLAHALGVSFAFPSTSVYVEATPDKPLEAHPPTTVAELFQLVSAFGPGGAQARPHGPAFPDTFDAAAVADKGS